MGGGSIMAKTTSHITMDHDEIRRWVEERGSHPSRVAGTGDKDDPGLLRIDFPGYGAEESLEDISWDEFFQKFDQKRLAFLYQEETTGGETSFFSTLVRRDRVNEAG